MGDIAGPDGRTRVGIVDDHRAFRETLCQTIATFAELNLVWQAADGVAALEALARQPVEMIIADWSLHGLSGLELVRHLDTEFPHITTVVLSGRTEASIVTQACEAGVAAYVLKGSPAELRTAVHAVLRGEHYVSPRLAEIDPPCLP